MMRHLLIVLVVSLGLAACAPATVEVAPENGASNEFADGRLSPGDSQLDSGEYFEALSYAGQAGQFVTISLHSDEFDPYLIVLDPNGAKVAEIDDSAGYGLDIVLSLNLMTSGAYTLVVTSYEPGETGTFTLSVETGPEDGAAPVWQPGGRT
ncbi:MAG TPA: hypothetical protein VF168_04795 [Trueperaceae bacterium]